MSEVAVRPIVEGEEVAPQPRAARRTVVLVAWAATLLLSQLPLAIARDLFGADIPWIVPAWIAGALLLFGLTFIWGTLRPLRLYFAIMAPIILFAYVVTPAVVGSAAWTSAFAGSHPVLSLFVVRIVLSLETAIVLGLLLALGLRRRELFLTRGRLDAPVRGLRIAGRQVSWALLGPVLILLLGGLFFLVMAADNPTALGSFAAAIPWLPLVLLAAGMNAFFEEGMYRAAPLALLGPAVGGRQAIWLTAVWFGLGHYFGGIPSGPIGAAQAGFLGLLLGKAMLDTRGLGWPWIIHVAMDTVIYAFFAMLAGVPVG